MSKYDKLKKRLDYIKLRDNLLVMSISGLFTAVFGVFLIDVVPFFVAFIVLTIFFVLMNAGIRIVLKRISLRYSALVSEIEKLSGSTEEIRRLMEVVYNEYPPRRKGEQFKVAYNLKGHKIDEFEKRIAIGMNRENKEVYVTAFVKRNKVRRVTASIGSTYQCSNSDNPIYWEKYCDKLNCDEIRHYHNHPDYGNFTSPSRKDVISIKFRKTYFGSHGEKVRSFIIYWNEINEWRILEYDENGETWISSEFDVSETYAK